MNKNKKALLFHKTPPIIHFVENTEEYSVHAIKFPNVYKKEAKPGIKCDIVRMSTSEEISWMKKSK